MSYYLSKFNFVGLIKKENVHKLSCEFLDSFTCDRDEDGNIVDFFPDDMKLNFETIVAENAKFFEPNSYLDMVGEDGIPFRWYIEPDNDIGFSEVNGYILFPRSPEAVVKLKNFAKLKQIDIV